MMNSKQDSGRKTLLTSASLLAAVAAAFTGAPAQAQEVDDGEAIIVTGSRIPQANLITTSPITQVTAEDITTQGVTRLEDLTNQLPQVFAAQGSNYSNGASGTAQVNLRGLGATRTLVLLNGRRMPYGSPNSSPADVNQIPGQMVERVEVLTGGASAVYGSDAVAGVVNFIMRDDFEGLRLDAQYGWYQHNNDFDGDGFLRQVIAARGATNPAQFQLPEENQDDGISKEVSAIFGASSVDGRGNITAYMTYRANDQVLQRDRDFSACALGAPSTAAVAGVPAGATHWTCGGSGTSFPGRFTDFSAFNFTIDQTTGNFIPFNNNLHQYNFGPLNYYQRPDERYALGAFAHYEINDRAEAYAEMMFNDYQSTSQIAPSGDFFNTTTINCGNPLLPANKSLIGCGPAQVAANTVVPFYVGRRNVEGGGRRDSLNYQSYRTVLGVRGPLTDTWDYDISGGYSRVTLARTYQNDFSVTRLTRALNVVDVAGTPTCQSVVDGTDPQCVPYNVFTPGGVTQAALNYVQIPLMQTGETIQQNVIATVTGDFGFGSPAAESNFEAAFGVEYRRDELNTTTDASFQSGDGAGQGGPTLGLSGVSDVFEVFGEARLPLVEGAAFADLISVDMAYRYSEYGSGITTNTYKIGADWAPTEDIRFRGSFARAVRAANVIELFSAQGAGLFDMSDDPCDLNDPGTDGVGIAAICQAAVPLPYQVTPAQAASGALDSPAGQYNGLFGGNPNLGPESADTTTIGLVFTPSFISNFTMSIDYFKIEVTDTVSTVGATNTINDCYLSGNLSACALIRRNPGSGQLWIGQGQVSDLNANIGGLTTSGIDINANYNFEIGQLGNLGFQLIATKLDELITDPGAVTGVLPYDCVGFWGNACGTPNPEWRHRFRITWETPVGLELNATWRHFGEVDKASAGFTTNGHLAVIGRLDSTFEAEDYLDLSGTYSLYENTRLRFGVNNVMDNDPPISDGVGAGAGNGNTFPQVYDSLGRWVFAGVTVDF